MVKKPSSKVKKPSLSTPQKTKEKTDQPKPNYNINISTVENKPAEVMREQMLTDRMLRNPHNNQCPICDYRPVIVLQKQTNAKGKLIYAAFRCRKCGHTWEEKGNK